MRSTVLQKRFFLVLLVMAVTVYTALSTGFVMFHRLVYILVVTTVLSFIWSWTSLKALEVSAERRSRRVNVGDDVEERITVRNMGLLPKPVLEVEDLTDLPGYTTGMAVAPPSKGFRSWKTSTPARKRGLYTLGPVRVSNTDVFGMFRRERTFGGTDTLIVYPRTFDVAGFNIPAAYLSGEGSRRKRSHDLTPHAASVREYAFGDSISRVHWNSTAKLGKLMSKQFDLSMSSDVWILLDLFQDIQAGELEESTDEYAVSIAASLAKKYLEAHLPVGLVAYGDKRFFLSPDTGGGQLDRVMDTLATAKAEGNVPLEATLAREEALWGYQSSLVVVTSSHRRQWVTALEELVRRRASIAVVLVDGHSFGGAFHTLDIVPQVYEAGVTPYVVRMGDNMAEALRRPYTAPGLGVSAEAVETAAMR